jgi:hypothetical protein
MPSCLSNSELVYLDGILVASTIVVIFESETNYRLRTGDDLPDGGGAVAHRSEGSLAHSAVSAFPRSHLCYLSTYLY